MLAQAAFFNQKLQYDYEISRKYSNTKYCSLAVLYFIYKYTFTKLNFRPTEIIAICLFGAQETFHSINVENHETIFIIL